jgi:transposase
MLTFAEAIAENMRLHQELANLRAELAKACAELAKTREQAEASQRQVQDLVAEVGRLGQIIAENNDRIGELVAAVKRNKSTRTPPPSKPVPPASPLPEEVAKALEERPRPPELPPKTKPEPKPRRPTGRKPLPSHLKADESESRPDCCPRCHGHNLEVIDEVVEEKLDVVREHQRRRVVRRKTVRCRDCRTRSTGEAPPAPFARSKVTCDWLAWLMVQKFYLLVPLDRIRRYLALQGIALSISFLVSMVTRSSDILEIIDGEHWKSLKAGPWMQSDGTGLKVIVEGLPGTHKGYLEVFRRDETVVFQYEAEKGSQTFADKFKGYKGLLLVDAEHRHNQVFKSGDVIEAGCNAHGFRKYEEAESVQPVLAAEGSAFLSAVFVTEEEAHKQGLQGDALREWRQTKIKPIFGEFRKWMSVVAPSLVPRDPLAGAIQYYANHWEALTRFLDHPEIPPDNSASEREFQTVAKARLNWLFAGSTEGAHRAAVLLGIVATCRNLGIDVQAYLTWVFERQGTHRHKYSMSASQLTPAAYKAAHPGARGAG